jgi:hypothetical protein
MRDIWNETNGANRFIMIGVAIALIVILLGAMIIGTSFLGDKSKNANAPIEDGLGGTIPPSSTTPRTPAQPSDVTPTTLYKGMTQYQIENPESDIENDAQLAFEYNQKSSGLTPKAYDVASKVGKDFILAQATGVGASQFVDYFDTEPADPWVDNYEYIYATAMVTDDPTLIKAIVWFKGKERASGLEMDFVKEGVYLTRPTADSLDIQPKSWGNGFPPSDPDIGISVRG